MSDLEGQLELLERVAGKIGMRAVATGGTGEALELLTVDGDGYPRSAWLGPSEIHVLSSGRIGLAVWRGSTTARNLHERPLAVLQYVVDATIVRLRLEAKYVCDLDVVGVELGVFRAEPSGVRVDFAPYADVRSGPTYSLRDAAGVLRRWDEQSREVEAVLEAFA